jgi:hypothetical protein
MEKNALRRVENDVLKDEMTIFKAARNDRLYRRGKNFINGGPASIRVMDDEDRVVECERVFE